MARQYNNLPYITQLQSDNYSIHSIFHCIAEQRTQSHTVFVFPNPHICILQAVDVQ